MSRKIKIRTKTKVGKRKPVKPKKPMGGILTEKIIVAVEKKNKEK